MRAVNLIPPDTRRPGLTGAGSLTISPSYLILAALAIAVALVTALVLTNNTISQREATIAGLQTQLANEQALAGRLAPYQRFTQLAQARVATVRQIAATRFDWHGALSDLSKVVPANTSLQSLDASVTPGTSAGGVGVRGDIPAPAFSLTGCTRTQDDVARLMSRLRLMNGVTRVTLQSSTGADLPGNTSRGVCQSGPSFQIVVFFSAPPTLAVSTPTTGPAK
jgi:Tfp pilus assembly protein PilN